MRRLLSTFTGLVVLSVVSAGARAETIESVEQKITEAMGKHKTMQYKTKTTTDSQSDDFKMKYESESVTQYARRGEKFLCRSEAKFTSVTKMKDQPESKEEGKILMIQDGEFTYTLSETKTNKTAVKTKIGQNTLNTKAMFKLWREDYEVKLLPDESVDGKSTYVLEMTPKKKNDAMARAVHYYQKDTGIVVKSVVYDKSGKANTTSTSSEIKTNVDISPDRFVFKAPPGVEVMDMTKTQEQSKETAEKPKSSKETEETKKEEPKESKSEDKQAKQEPVKKNGVGGLLKKLGAP